jgi:hypothetical protein
MPHAESALPLTAAMRDRESRCPPEFVIRVAFLKQDDDCLLAHLERCHRCADIFRLSLTRRQKGQKSLC